MPSTHVSLTYHIVFSTKQREHLIERPWRERLYEYFGGCIRTSGGVCLEIGGTANHIHILAGLRATLCVADFLRDIKRATSSWARETTLPTFTWQEGYGAFTVGREYPDLVRYVRGQEEHHRHRTFEDEYRELLEQSGVEYDERYLW
ncbi:MAG: transposase [Acidobacteriota bacterium]